MSQGPPRADLDETASGGDELPTPGRVAAVLGGSFLAVSAAVLVVVLVAQDGTFTYAVDDAAIHLTLGRVLAEHGTFGIEPGVYESASSAPLWDLALAPVMRVAPGAWWLPLLFEVACAGWVLACFARLDALRRVAATRAGLLVVAAVPIALGLTALAMTGMEHVLHAAVVLQVLALVHDRYRRPPSGRATAALLALLALGVLVRFEMGFLAAGIVLALLAVPPRDDRRSAVRTAGAVVAAVAVPAVGFAIVNRAFGQYPLPNSVVAKTSVGEGLPIPTPSEVWARATTDLVLLLLLAAAVVALAARGALLRRSAAPAARGALAVLVAVTTTAGLHLLFADVGWFHRYQAYLVVALVYALLLAAPHLGLQAPVRTATVGLLVLAGLRLPLLLDTPVATYDVYEDQYQVARFLDAEYPGAPVAVNDIGYVSWEHEGTVLDLYGLASHDLLRARKEGRYTPELLAEHLRARGVEVLVVYDEIFGGVVPAEWEAAGRWCFTGRHVVLSADCITFYAPAGARAAELADRLAAYAPDLPSSVATTTTT